MKQPLLLDLIFNSIAGDPNTDFNKIINILFHYRDLLKVKTNFATGNIA